MLKKCVLAIDQGTTGTTACLIDKSGLIFAKSNRSFRQIFPEPGWVEHHPDDLWQSVLYAIEDVMKQSEESEIVAIGIANQRETVFVWDRLTSQPIYNGIVWQCRRSTDFCQRLCQDSKVPKIIKEKTGLTIDPYFSSSKINWLLENISGASRLAQKERLVLGTVDSFLLWRLTSGQVHATDVSNASRTQLMNIQNGQWDPDLLNIFSIPQSLLPQVYPSAHIFGFTKGLKILPDGIPISAMIGDQQASLFGQGCFQLGDAKCTLGTGSFFLLNTGDQCINTQSGLSTIAWQLQNAKKVYALEGSVLNCGSVISWLQEGLGFIKNSNQIDQLALQVESTEGVEFIPALTGLGSPYWNPHARGMISGLTRSCRPAHIARAALEAIALQNCEMIWSIEKDFQKIEKLKIDGGVSQSDLLMQYQADYLGIEIVRDSMIEKTALGAGWIAGLSVGFWKDVSDIYQSLKKGKSFQPTISKMQRKLRLQRWQKAITKVL